MTDKFNRSEEWWKNSVIYQIFPRTFADANGDGSGDLQGITQRLDYLNDGNLDSDRSLHIDAIWLSPINKSPMYDNGYDVSDYCAIAPVFGDIQDLESLLAEAHQRNIKVILDLVINHTSEQHPWFEESRSSKDNPKAIGITGKILVTMVYLITGYPIMAGQPGLIAKADSNIITIPLMANSPT